MEFGDGRKSAVWHVQFERGVGFPEEEDLPRRLWKGFGADGRWEGTVEVSMSAGRSISNSPAKNSGGLKFKIGFSV